jgi:hypothetical protein
MDLHTCWEQSKEHKRHFLDHLDCRHRQQYHQQERGCKPFDDLVARWAGNDRLSFFSYYRVVGTKPPIATYTEGLIPVSDKALLRRMAQLSLVKRFPDEIDPLPERYQDWPDHFTLQAVYPSNFAEDRGDILDAIEACINRRQVFRNACIRSCCKRIDTRTHDTFLLVLQILRARLVVYQPGAALA